MGRTQDTLEAARIRLAAADSPDPGRTRAAHILDNPAGRQAGPDTRRTREGQADNPPGHSPGPRTGSRELRPAAAVPDLAPGRTREARSRAGRGAADYGSSRKPEPPVGSRSRRSMGMEPIGRPA
jgi:hypothetical protein